MILTRDRPGSIAEFLNVIGPLPTRPNMAAARKIQMKHAA